MISVALCTYNGEKYLRQQLDSILSQTKPVDEIVVVDDCSQDATCSILAAYSSAHPEIRWINNETNIGSNKNFERALKECHGDYIFFSDQDDVWDPDKVSVMVSYLKNSGMYGAFSDGRLIGQDGKELDGRTLFSSMNLLPYIEEQLIDAYALEILCMRGNFVTGATMAISKSAKEFLLPFLTSKYIIHDFWMALMLSGRRQLGCINRPLISYRIHPSQQVGLVHVNPWTIDPLFNCFVARGECRLLLPMRRLTSVPVYYGRLRSEERTRITKTYRSLYFKNLGKGVFVRMIDVCLFVVSELYYYLRTKIGYDKVE